LEQAYARTMKRELFDPIGMPTAEITNDPSDLGDNVARSYAYDLRFGERPDRFLPYSTLQMASPAGAAALSITDMARFLITQLHGGGTPDGRRPVSRDVLAVTWQGQAREDDFANYARRSDERR